MNGIVLPSSSSWIVWAACHGWMFSSLARRTDRSSYCAVDWAVWVTAANAPFGQTKIGTYFPAGSRYPLPFHAALACTEAGADRWRSQSRAGTGSGRDKGPRYGAAYAAGSWKGRRETGPKTPAGD